MRGHGNDGENEDENVIGQECGIDTGIGMMMSSQSNRQDARKCYADCVSSSSIQ